MEFKDLVVYIRENYPQNSIEINDCLGLLLETIDSLLNSIQESSSHAFSQRDFNKIPFLAEVAKDISSFEDKIKEIMDDLDPEELSDKDQNQDVDEDMSIPNYKDYIVDSNMPHTIYEDFTNKRPAAFCIDNYRVEVRTWQDILIKTCEYLIENSRDIFESFINDPSMNGKKMNYFALEDKGMRRALKPLNSPIFIESSMNANGIRNLIAKMLRKYEIKPTRFTVFLRADYSVLHE